MTVFDMVVAIVVVTVGAGVINNWLKTRAKASGPEVDKRIAERLGRVDELEERVRTLEKIVTDRHYDLKERFRELES